MTNKKVLLHRTTLALKGIIDNVFWGHFEWPLPRNIDSGYPKLHVPMRKQFHDSFSFTELEKS